MIWEACCRKSMCHLRYSAAICPLWLRITIERLENLPTWSKPNVNHKYIPHCSSFILFKIVMMWSERFRNETKLVYGVCYTCDNTVTPVYANPFIHESSNTPSYLFMVLKQNMCWNFHTWFVFLKHLTYAQIVHKIHTLRDPLLPVQYNWYSNFIYIIFNIWTHKVIKFIIL